MTRINTYVIGEFFIENVRRYESGERDIFERKPGQEVLQEFRMTKHEIYNFCDVVQEDMQPMGSRSIDLTLLDKILICLMALASGGFQNCRKDFMHVTQPTVRRVLSAFVNSNVSKTSQHIYMPKNETDISRTVTDFQQILGMPMVVGAIDGSHIPMIAPPIDEYA